MMSQTNSGGILGDEFDEREQRHSLISQWASQVLDFSDSYGSESSISYSAVNVCGRPSKFPAYGDFAECFSMRRYGPANSWSEQEFSSKDQHDIITFHDFIVVQYETFVLPKEIRIYETYHPGSVVRILAYCAISKCWKVLWKSLPAPVEKKAREFRPPINQIDFPIRVLRIEFNHSLIDYYTGIDGILLNGIKFDLPVEKPLAERKGIIQKKLETVQFVPQRTPSEAIEDFLKNDLNKFIENVGLGSKDPVVEPRASEREKVIGDIPYEVLFNILSFLDLKSLFQCSQVCKSFRHLAADPLLYVEVNLKFYWNFVNSRLIQTLSQRCGLIRKLDLSSCGYFDAIQPSDFVSFIRANGKSLTNLRLNSSQFLNTSCLETISITCGNLTELMIRNYMNVTADRDFLSLTMLNRLEVLDLSRSGIDLSALLNILKNNQSLRHLNIAFSSQAVSMDEVCIQISAFNKDIRTIDMWKCHNLTAAGIRALSCCHQLEEVDIGWCLREESTITESLKMLIGNCRNLRKLILAAIRGISERDLENIAKTCKNMETLDLMGIVGVSSEICVRLLESCSKLKLLDVSFCENIDDVSVMIWRSTYNVCIKRSEVPNDG